MSDELETLVCDEEAARLLPWLVAGRLDPADAERVTRHLGHCAICRADLAREQRVRDLLKADGTLAYAPQAGLQRTLARIDELTREAPEPAGFPEPVTAPAGGARRFSAPQWLAAAVVVQAVGLGVLGAAWWGRAAPPADARYQTLSSAAAPTTRVPAIRAVFAPTMTLAELRTLLAARGLVIVAGPNDAGALALAVQDPHPGDPLLATVLVALRADSRVLFAEPVASDRGGSR